jgi:Mrp family chromosome partitioning ATPase/uncharacterized protein involved in exopolysaccharide biosynthesis
VPRTFESIGVIRIRPNVQRILYQTESNAVIPMFQSYVDSQASLIRSDAVIEQAMRNEAWQALSPGEVNSASTGAFASKLEVRHPRGSEMIQVAFTDTDPNVPAVAVRSTIEAYVRLYGERDAKMEAQTLQVLETRRAALIEEQDKLNGQMLEIANDYGSNALEPLVQYKAQELNEIRSELRRVKLAILNIAGGRPAGVADPTTMPVAAGANPEADTDATKLAAGPSRAEPQAPAEIPVELLANQDWLMRNLLQQRLELQRTIEVTQLRVGANHPTLREHVTRLAAVNRDIASHATLLRANLPAVAAVGTNADDQAVSGVIAGDPAVALARLRGQETNLQTFFDATKAEMAELGRKNLLMQSLKSDWNDVQHRLDEIKRRTEQLSVESGASGRVEVMDYGNRPVRPSGNKRRAWTGLGGSAGLALGVGIIAFIGLLDRRRVLAMTDANSSSHRRTGRFPILGAIPSLSAETASGAHIQLTAEAVHRIRARLQIQRGASDCRVIALTSPSSGDGKTSMTIALGMSFAAGGSKTLLIEGDVVGGGLTGRLEAKVQDDVARVLHDEGLLTPDRLETVRRRATEQRRPIEDVLLDSGWANEADLARAEVLQAKRKLGLLDVLNGRPLAECVAPAQAHGLFVLPLGNAKQADIPQISPEAARRLLEQAREQYDTVLIDTGPILGSLEAAVMTAAADGVVLLVSRGDQRSTLEAAIAELESLHANVVGAIYNRAQEGEFTPGNASLHASRMFTSRPSQGPDMPFGRKGASGVRSRGAKDGQGNGRKAGSPEAPATAPQPARIGPVAAAVAGTAPGANGSNGRH